MSQARLYSSILQKAFGDTVDIAAFSESEEAAEYLGDHLVDVLITDLRMPNVDGAWRSLSAGPERSRNHQRLDRRLDAR